MMTLTTFAAMTKQEADDFAFKLYEQRPFIYGDDFDLMKWYNEAAFKRMRK